MKGLELEEEKERDMELLLNPPWEDDLYDELKSTNLRFLQLKKDNVTLDDLLIEYNLLCFQLNKNNLDDHHKLLFERYKLLIIQTIEAYFYELEHKKYPTKKVPEIHQSNWFFSKILSFCGISMSGASGFLSGVGLLSLIQGISNPVVFTVSTFFGVINSILFSSFEGNKIKQSLGVDSLDKTATSLLSIHQKQIESTERINHLFFNINTGNKITSRNYKKIAFLNTKFNNDIHVKKENFMFSKYKETTFKKWMRNGITFLGALLQLGGTYFFMKAIGIAIVGTAATAAFLATPVGWIVAVTAMMMSLALYSQLRAKAMFYLVNSEFQPFQNIVEALNHFDIKNKDDYEEAMNNHKRLIPIETNPTSLSQSFSPTPTPPSPRSPSSSPLIEEEIEEERRYLLGC
jgi:hypothetical protein